MGCFTELSQAADNVKFQLKEDAQKILIDNILSYSELDCKSLAGILEVSPLMLSQVLAGKAALDCGTARCLFEYFIMMIEC